MKKIIRDDVAACEICQRNKASTLAPAGFLQPLPIPGLISQWISLEVTKGSRERHYLSGSG